MADTKPVPTSPGTTFEYIPVDRIIPGNTVEITGQVVETPGFLLSEAKEDTTLTTIMIMSTTTTTTTRFL
jgi:hypothetical protein